MWQLLAQQQQSALLDFIEKLARTPISSVLLFAAICTVARVGLHYYLIRLNPLDRKQVGAIIIRWLHDLADALVYAGILVFLLIRPFVVQTFRIPSESMVPTLQVGDLLIVNKAVYRYSEPQAGDIVVFKPPARALEPEQDPSTDFVKRLIGTPGQVIEIKNRQLYRDGQTVNENYVNHSIDFVQQNTEFKLVEYPPGSKNVIPLLRDAQGNPAAKSIYSEIPPVDFQKAWSLPAVPVPPGKYLMMGDNRDGSYDGRFWGLISRRQIVGKAWLTFWPINRFGGADKRPRS